MAKKRIEELEIVNYEYLNKEYFTLELKSNRKLPDIHPGQFVELRINGHHHVFLRRPFSFHDINTGKNTFTLLIQIVGQGTSDLSRIRAGDTLNTIYPLGNSFTIPENGNYLLVGGGCGVAPLLLLARKLLQFNNTVHFLIGTKTKNDLIEIDLYKQLGNVNITTEDGSEGEKGFVIHHPVLWDESIEFDGIYTCGPEDMMKAISKYALKRGINCEVSLENMMACGIGACLCCVTETIKGNVCVCTEGPVFNSGDLKWQI
ncbi:dihydroorotate dehydrogenase electron transfer subunit [Bacteroidota bacterium]